MSQEEEGQTLDVLENSDVSLSMPPAKERTEASSPCAKKELVRSAGIVGLMTLLSRVLGMIRDIVSAKQFGTTWQWDAFIYAFALPNFLRRLVGEGALSSAFIPVYSETSQRQGKSEANRFANVVFTLLGGALALFLLAVEGVLHLLLQNPALSERLRLVVDLLRYFFPYLWFISLTALTMGILNCHRDFFTPSLSPVILDLFWIAGVLWVAPLFGKMPQDQLHGLAWVILLSGAVQLGVQIPPLYRLGFRLHWVWETADQGLKKTTHLLLPSIFSFAIVQINLLVDMTLGLTIGPGANSALWYGTRLMQFPLGVFAIAIGTALLPMISHYAAKKEMEMAKKTLSFALRCVFLIILPCAVGLMVLSVPIVQILFERGEFDQVSTARTAAVLFCYSIGLFAYSGQKILTAGFYAVQDTRTPVKLGIVALVSNIIFNLILMRYFAEAGLALATSISGILQFILLIAFYHRKVSPFPFREMAESFVRILLASLAMGGVAFFLHGTLSTRFPGAGLTPQLLQVFGSIGLSVLAYFFFCLIFRVKEMKEALDWVLKNKKGARPL